MSPAASSPTNCDAEELQPDFVASLAGILVLTGDAREGLVCLEGKVVAIHLEEETNSTCPSPKAWCSDYGSKDECESAHHSLTGEPCHWVAPPGRNLTTSTSKPPFPFSTCSSQPRSCPDGRCDQHEASQPGICPQDCTPKGRIRMSGTQVFSHQSGLGIRAVAVPGLVCVCSPQSCQCTHPTYQQQPLYASQHPEFCDDHCVLGFTLSASLLLAFVFAFTLIWGTRIRCCPPPGKKYSLSSGSGDSVNDFTEDARSTASTQATHMTLLSSSAPTVHYQHAFMIDPKYEIPRGDLVLEDTLGEGEFGKVVLASLNNLRGKPGLTRVAVKMLKPHHSGSEHAEADLLSEYNLLKEVDHPNVVKLLGACTDRRGPVYIVMEFAKHGSLRNYLRRHRDSSSGQVSGSRASALETSGSTASTSLSIDQEPELTEKEVLGFAWQVAKGMAYLADMRLVHRDLATRNVLVGEGRVAKVADFGLTRDVYIDEAYWKKSSGKLPIKWMAPESMKDYLYTSKSDVWGFGVLMWELATLGSSPYPGVMPERLYGLLHAGYRMTRPPGCSLFMYNLMLECWNYDPDNRPTFKSLTHRLESCLQDSATYLQLDMALAMEESEEISSDTILPPLAVHNLSYIGATHVRREGEVEEGEGSPLVEPDTPTESTGGRYLVPDGTPGDAWESDSLDRCGSAYLAMEALPPPPGTLVQIRPFPHRKKHPVVPEQYARVVGFGEPMDTGAL